MVAASRFLIVDDEMEWAELLKETFLEAGYVADARGSARDALLAIGEHHYDAVLTDIAMPSMDGLDLLTEIKSQKDSPAVVLMSGYETVSLEDLHHQGASELIAKPFAPQEALGVVRRAGIPASERWKSQNNLDQAAREMFLGLKFQSLEQAVADGSLHLGSGGLFLRLGAAYLPKKAAVVGFSFEFSDGPILHMEGIGRMKWMRPSDHLSNPSGCGIEILELAPHCLAAIVGEISRLQSPNFIPKS